MVSFSWCVAAVGSVAQQMALTIHSPSYGFVLSSGLIVFSVILYTGLRNLSDLTLLCCFESVHKSSFILCYVHTDLFLVKARPINGLLWAPFIVKVQDAPFVYYTMICATSSDLLIGCCVDNETVSTNHRG